MAAIEMKNIVKQYGDGFPAVNDVSLDIADGEFMILVGPSGCGKSTLLRMIVGLEDITSRRHDHRRRAGQRQGARATATWPWCSRTTRSTRTSRCSRTSRSRCGCARVDDDESSARSSEAADVLELHEHLERKPANLSGGQRQRVAMGRAIVREAEAFLFDEPLSNLDAKLRGQMRTEISRLQRRLGITTVYVTHDQTEAMTLGDRVAVLRKGLLQQVASPRELYEQPVNLFVAGFIGSPPMNFLPATVEGSTPGDPFGTVDLDERKAARGGRARTWSSSACGPEYFEDASLVDAAKRDTGSLHGDGRRHGVARRRAVRLHPLRRAGGGDHPAARALPRARQRPAPDPGHRLHRRRQPDPRGPGGRVLGGHPEGPLLRPGVGREPDP